jgi:hypothetical protein
MARKPEDAPNVIRVTRASYIYVLYFYTLFTAFFQLVFDGSGCLVLCDAFGFSKELMQAP